MSKIIDVHAREILDSRGYPTIEVEVKSEKGFVGIASDLVSYDSKYYNIVMNQLGNIIVCENVTTAIQVRRKINHRYRVVSVDGEIIHVGGVMTGGSLKSNSSYISDKYELDNGATLLLNQLYQ